MTALDTSDVCVWNHQALAEFDMYRQRIEDDQLCTEAQHTQRVVSMSREVTRAHANTTILVVIPSLSSKGKVMFMEAVHLQIFTAKRDHYLAYPSAALR